MKICLQSSNAVSKSITIKNCSTNWSSRIYYSGLTSLYRSRSSVFSITNNDVANTVSRCDRIIYCSHWIVRGIIR